MNQRKKHAGVFLLANIWLLQAASVATAQTEIAPDTMSTTLFEGARLIIGDDRGPIENSAFIVDHGRFTKIGRKGEIQLPQGATRIDLSGKTIIPALIDAHVHAGGPTPGLHDAWPTREAYLDFLRLEAYLGVAAVTSMGRDTWAAAVVRAEAPIDGARLLSCGQGMTGLLGQPKRTIEAGTEGRLPEDLNAYEFQASTPEMARDHIREQASLKVDCMKIWYNDRGGLEKRMSTAVLQAILDEAHRHNIPVYSDSWRLDEFKEAVRDGLDGFAHPVRDRDVDDELVQMLKDRPNVFIMTNFGMPPVKPGTVPAYTKDPLFLSIATQEQRERFSGGSRHSLVVHEGWESDSIEYARERYNIIVRNTKRLYKAGIPYAVGTDAGGFNIHTQIEALVKDIGLTPSQAITMATRDGARVQGLRNLGTVASGKDASFVVLDANPLDDITNTRRIADVYLRGHKVDRARFLETWKQHQAHRSNSTN